MGNLGRIIVTRRQPNPLLVLQAVPLPPVLQPAHRLTDISIVDQLQLALRVSVAVEGPFHPVQTVSKQITWDLNGRRCAECVGLKSSGPLFRYHGDPHEDHNDPQIL